MLRDALATGMPVLGICRGHQLLNVIRGGSLHQDLGERGGSTRPDAHAGRRTHPVGNSAGTASRRMLGARATVPTLHHQAVRRVGHGLTVAARSDDGVVEAIEDPRLPFAVGVQWHAELPEAGEAGRRLRDALAEAAQRHAVAA